MCSLDTRVTVRMKDLSEYFFFLSKQICFKLAESRCHRLLFCRCSSLSSDIGVFLGVRHIIPSFDSGGLGRTNATPLSSHQLPSAFWDFWVAVWEPDGTSSPGYHVATLLPLSSALLVPRPQLSKLLKYDSFILFSSSSSFFPPI